MPEGDDRVHEDLAGGRTDLGHPAGADRTAGHSGEHAEQHPGEYAGEPAAQRALVPGRWSGACAGRGPPQRGAHSTGSDQRGSGVHAGVGPLSGSAASSGNIGTGPTRDHGRRDEGAGADREAGTEQVGAGEQHGVRQHRQAAGAEQHGVTGVGVQPGEHVQRGAEVEQRSATVKAKRAGEEGRAASLATVCAVARTAAGASDSQTASRPEPIVIAAPADQAGEHDRPADHRPERRLASRRCRRSTASARRR